jgi:hypothetical protein
MATQLPCVRTLPWEVTQLDGANAPLILKNIAGQGTATALHNDDFPLLEAAAFLTV